MQPLPGPKRQSDLHVAVVDAVSAAEIMEWVIDTQFKNEERTFKLPPGVILVEHVGVVQAE
ncbi:hypothetical protein ACFY7Y_32565 [Streptomyces virginiae]|uniref:hypothetical protein n=1 Tax=Streptomyces virginiae TaxID=1961 RepID=UPI0036C2FDD0